jgi:predicted metal-binding protein
MVIDGRELEVEEVLKEVRAFLNERVSLEESAEVLVGSPEVAKKVKAFASMTGVETEAQRMDGYWKLRVSGGSCRCG